MKKYNIAFLLGYPEISGGTNVIMEHAVGLKKKGHNVAIVTELPFEKKRLAWHPEAMILDCYSHEQVKDIEFDIAIATWWRSVYDLPYVQAKKFAYFCQSIETRFFDSSDLAMKALVEFTYRMNLPVVTEATWIANYLRDHYGMESTLVRNGLKKDIFTIDGESKDSSRPKGLRVLVEGPMGVYFKKTEDTIRICQEAGIEDIWLLTSSEVEEYPGISKLYSKVPMKEVSSIYRSCDVLVKLSIVEGMFGPPLEMMHCGGTAITNNVTGHDEYMVSYHNGIVTDMGNEQQVIKALQMLKTNPALLQKLKSGARDTAINWPDWPKAINEMEQFIIGVIEQDTSDLDFKETQKDVLKAALRFAGPLESTTKQTYNKKELLEIFKKHLKLYANKKFPTLYNNLKNKKNEKNRVQNAPLPELSILSLEQSKEKYHVAFIGDKSIHSIAFRPKQENYLSLFVDFEKLKREDSIKRLLKEFKPDILFVFKKEFIENEEYNPNVNGKIIFISTEAIHSSNLSFYNKYFAKGNESKYLLHISSRDTRELMKNNLNVIGSLDLPIYVQEIEINNWNSRMIKYLLIGEISNYNKDFVRVIKESGINYVHIKESSDTALAAKMVLNSKFVLYLPQEDQCLLKSTNIMRDMLCDAIVITQEFTPNYATMPNEHYLHYEKPSQLRTLLATLESFEDKYMHIQSVGKEKAKEFVVDQQFINIIKNIDIKGI
ncbi:glycosyltransferase [Psychrobacillus soli]|uniref:Glycosyltransferase family 4 protein n=1 Tax=Psychrobacillus soli TaxID=1543965 RepID=A0A544TL55_9BACI|nr:glycosyltransferase [Psychrobacillus soli]TQR18158.1 glycosyltransferase family 4 protein [Psychrobacillus soli]